MEEEFGIPWSTFCVCMCVIKREKIYLKKIKLNSLNFEMQLETKSRLEFGRVESQFCYNLRMKRISIVVVRKRIGNSFLGSSLSANLFLFRDVQVCAGRGLWMSISAKIYKDKGRKQKKVEKDGLEQFCCTCTHTLVCFLWWKSEEKIAWSAESWTLNLANCLANFRE